MDATDLAVAAAGLFVAGIIKGTTGLGYSTCALPFLVSAFGLRTAMTMVLAPAMTTNVSLALSTGHLRETLSRFGLLYIAMLPGILVGIQLLLWVSQTGAVAVLGVAIVFYAAMSLWSPGMALSAGAERALRIPTGFLNGVVTGLTGSQVMPLFPYVLALNLAPDRMVQAINLAVLIASAILCAGLASAGVFTVPLLMASLLAIGPALAGVGIGARARRLLPVAVLRKIVLITLLVMGGQMLMPLATSADFATALEAARSTVDAAGPWLAALVAMVVGTASGAPAARLP